MWKAFSSWEPPEKKRKGGKDGLGGADDSDEDVSTHASPPPAPLTKLHFLGQPKSLPT